MNIYEQEDKQYSYLPIKDSTIFEFRQQLLHSHWNAEEAINVNTTALDRKDWKTITPGEQNLLKFILAFFAVGDGIVNEKIDNVIKRRVKHRDWISFENQKVSQEDIHNRTYSMLVDIYIDDDVERKSILENTLKYESINRKIEWFNKWFSDNEYSYLPEKELEFLKSLGNPELDKKLNAGQISLQKVLFLMIIMEGLFFSGSFCIIYWFKERGLFPALSKANSWIARDEGTHTKYNLYIYNSFEDKLSAEEAAQIMREAVETEHQFMCEALPEPLLGINSDLVTRYIKFVADNLMYEMGYKTIYGVENPFKFMDKISIDKNTDFFVGKSEDYNTSITEIEKINIDFDI